MTERERLGLFQGLFSTVLFALASTTSKFLLDVISPESLVLIGEVLSILTLFLLFGLNTEFTKLRKFKPKTLIALSISSILAGAISPFMFIKGLSMTTVTDSVMIASMSGILTSILASFFLNDKFSLEKTLGMIFMFSGIAVIATKGFSNGLSINSGYYFLLSSVLAVSISTIIFKKYLTHVSTDITILSRNFWGILVILLIFPLFFTPNYDLRAVFDDQKILLILVSYAVFILVIAHFLWYKSLGKIKASLSSLLGFLKPLFGVIFAVLILKENFDKFHLIGGVLIISGLIFSMYHRKKHGPLIDHHQKHNWIPHWLHF